MEDELLGNWGWHTKSENPDWKLVPLSFGAEEEEAANMQVESPSEKYWGLKIHTTLVYFLF